MNEFPNKWWTKSNTNRLLKKFRDTGPVNRLRGSADLEVTALKKMLTWLSNDLVLSREDMPQIHRKVHEISIIG